MARTNQLRGENRLNGRSRGGRRGWASLSGAVATIVGALTLGFAQPAAADASAATSAPTTAAMPTTSAMPTAMDATAAAGASTFVLEVSQGKSQVLDVRSLFVDVMIANAAIADVIPFSNHSIYVVGKAQGSTSMSLYGPNKKLIAVVNVVVGPDMEGFKARLHDLLPNETDVTIRPANQNVILSGTVSNPAALSQILTLADIYAPGKVINMLGVEGTQQVMLSVRFVEMDRSTAKSLNVTIQGSNTNSNPAFTGGSGNGKNLQSAAPALTPFLFPANAFGAAGLVINNNIGLEIDALETKGLVKTLAEPSLITMSGETASFLAGGEFPIPVAQAGATGAGAITVQFKNFGISLGFTPTILKDGLINLIVKPEVSSLDASAGVTTGGVVVPGLKVRRADTTVELRDGETFTIAGLLSDNYQDAINQFPYAGDLPVLGALFRSPSFKQDKTELVIMVTPHLVTPRRGPVALPTDHFTPPSDYELFLFGSLNGDRHGAGAEDRALMSRDPTKGGIEGPYGHVLY